MRVNVFNPTDKPITEYIRGVAITVPARGCASVTELKAPALLKAHPALTLTSAAPYNDTDLAAMEKLTKEELQRAVRLMTRGVRVEFTGEFLAETGPAAGAAAGAEPEAKGKRKQA